MNLTRLPAHPRSGFKAKIIALKAARVLKIKIKSQISVRFQLLTKERMLKCNLRDFNSKRTNHKTSLVFLSDTKARKWRIQILNKLAN